ncbi:hypothetical protein, partial [Corynebacterium diphtheriae]|uniref:hypothetical protein n=1 Tax=Corynebacterium diphtheriae TaxID=1717 RepID=UPI001C4F7779
TGQVSHTGTSDYPHYRGYSQGNGAAIPAHMMGSMKEWRRKESSILSGLSVSELRVSVTS